MLNENNQSLLSKEQIESVISLYSSGNINQAIKRIKSLNEEYPNVPLLFNILGACYKSLGDIEGALQMFETATKIKSNYSEAHFNVGVVHQELNQHDSAIDSYKKAIAINPKYPDAHNNLGIVYLDSKDLDNAVVHFEYAINFSDNFAEAHNNLGSTFQQKGLLEKALNSYKKSITLKPDYAQAHNNMGILLQKIGNNKAAILSYEKALDSDPSYALAHHNLSALKIYSEDDVHITQMKSSLSSSNISQSDRVHLYFTLAKVSEDLGDNDMLFEYLNEGNQLRKNALNFSFENYNLVIQNLFQSCLSEIKKTYKSSSVNPIFIVGMPRSGTSLVEQIISNHPKVYGGGEMRNLTDILIPVLQGDPISGKINLTEEVIYSIGRQYLDALSSFNTPENIITDKWPLNFRNIGFILSAFPDAKIVHLERDPIATCWSIYKHYFNDAGNGWAYNLDDIAEFYSSYKELMAHWHKLYPNKIYDLCYEDLTIDQENETRKLLKYCKLDWDKSCLNFHTNKREVETASAIQVRQKMYQGSSEVWKKYKSYLKPLIKRLS
ncbi:MAG: tetratricopeptide (TPR) repeat protein [Methylophilaceae bacterium]|jgi:tetratricopeptide (TPR) repeat protein